MQKLEPSESEKKNVLVKRLSASYYFYPIYIWHRDDTAFSVTLASIFKIKIPQFLMLKLVTIARGNNFFLGSLYFLQAKGRLEVVAAFHDRIWYIRLVTESRTQNETYAQAVGTNGINFANFRLLSKQRNPYHGSGGFKTQSSVLTSSLMTRAPRCSCKFIFYSRDKLRPMLCR